MYALNDNFADPLGRWQEYAPWDASMYYDGSKGFLTTQEHVDIRNFRSFSQLGPRPQTSLEAFTQTVWEGGDQTTMETYAISTETEPWILSGTGLTTLTLGEIAARGGWSGLQVLTNGSAVNATLTSSIPNDNLDLSAQTDFLLILPDYNSFDTTSTIQLTSKPDGTFGTAAYNSTAVAFSANLDVMPQLRLALSGFMSGAGASFSLANVTGVQVTLLEASAPSSDLTVTLMGMRAVSSGWVPAWLDFDTRLGALCLPVTLDGTAYAGSVAQGFEFLRGDGSRNDPIPVDGAYNIYFYPGGATSPDDATGSDYNVLSVLLREIKDISGGTGSLITARIKWKDTSSSFECLRTDFTGGSGGTRTDTTVYTQSIGALDPTKHYLFRVESVGTQITPSLYETDLDGTLVSSTPIWNGNSVSSSDFVVRNGRVGFRAQLLSRDAYITDFEPAVTNYATLQTKVFNSRTPVNGGKLSAVFSSDDNLFTGFTGSYQLDSTKTFSGLTSYSTSTTITSNQFIIEDWTQSYLEAEVWVGVSVTPTNQPTFTLNTSGGAEVIPISVLQPNRWNHVYVDLSLFWHELTGSAYSITVAPGANPDRALGLYWIDGNFSVGRRRVSWALRAQPNGLWREFRDMINKPQTALHLNPDERGTSVQLRANALTPDAWVVSYKLRPHYSEVGNLVSDVA